MPPYDSALFTPPAPLAQVTLRNPANGATLANVPMLLDTGADVTLVPEEVVMRLGVLVDLSQGYELTGFDARRSVAHVANLHMVFLNRAFQGRFLLIGQPWGVLGRNVLNHLTLLLDGPRLSWSENSRGTEP